MPERPLEGTTSASGTAAQPNGRVAPRHPYVHFSWFHRLDCGSGHLAHTTDISERGVGFITAEEIAAGERIFLVLSTHKGRVNFIAKVMNVTRHDATTYQVGVVLEVIPPPDAAAWAALVKKVPR